MVYQTDYYLDLGDCTASRRLVICANSLPRLIREGKLLPREVLIIEEIEQVLAHIFAASFEGNRQEVWNVLVWHLQRATKIIISDADLSQVTIKIIQHLAGITSDDTDIIINDWSNDWSESSLTVMDYSDSNAWYEQLYQDVRAGRKLYITAVEQQRILNLRDDLQQRFPEKRILCITSANSQSPEVGKILRSPNCEAMQEYDMVLTSPAVSTGVSIDIDHFDCTFAYGDQGIIGGTDFVQQLLRPRQVTTVHLCLEAGGQYVGSEDPDDIRAEAITKKDLFGLRYSRDFDGSFQEEEYINAMAQVVAWQNRSRNAFAHHVRQLLIERGARLEKVQAASETNYQKHLRVVGKERRNQQIEQVLTAEPLASWEADLLRSMNYLPLSDKVRLTRYDIQQLYGHEPDRSLVEKHLHGKLEAQFREFRDLHTDDAELATRDQAERSTEFAPHLTLYLPKKELRQEILEVSGIGRDFQGQPNIEQFTAWLTEENRQRLKAVLGIPGRTGKEARALGDVLRQLGISWKSKKVKKTRKHVYTINQEDVRFMHDLRASATSEGTNTRIIILEENSPIGTPRHMTPFERMISWAA